MRLAFTAAALVALGACTTVPDSAAGVGFDDGLVPPRTQPAPIASTAAAVPAPLSISDEALPPAAPATGAPLAAPGLGAGAPAPIASVQTVSSVPVPASSAPQTAPQNDAILEAAAALDLAEGNSGVAPLQASPSNPAPTIIGNPGISDENDFQAVSARESIQSDAERLAEASATREVVSPTALPERAGNTQPNIVAYALETRHARGTRVYSRTGFNLAARAQRNCAQYASANQAQIAFLENGGPRRDRAGLDPDGDGYACAWDPAPFRKAVQN